MKRICLLIDTLKVGGKERVMAELANYFASKPGLEVHLIVFGSIRAIHYSLSESVTVHFPGFGYQATKRLRYLLLSLIFVRRKVKTLKPDTVLSFGEIWNSFVLISLFGLKFPVFISDRCRPDKNFVFVHSLLRRFLYPRADGIIAQTHAARNIYRKKFRRQNIAVIGNPIRNIDGPDPGEQREDIVLSVGRLIPTKNHKELIDLFLQIERPEWKLVIVGGDTKGQPMYDRLKDYIAEKGAQQRVFLQGEQSKVDNYYRKSRIFAFTSSSEGFPNVIGEAQSAGIPVVAFNCVAGPAELIEDRKNGFLVPLFDYDRFRHCLQLLMESDELRESMGRNARESIRKNSIDIIGEEFLSILFGKSIISDP